MNLTRPLDAKERQEFTELLDFLRNPPYNYSWVYLSKVAGYKSPSGAKMAYEKDGAGQVQNLTALRRHVARLQQHAEGSVEQLAVGAPSASEEADAALVAALQEPVPTEEDNAPPAVEFHEHVSPSSPAVAEAKTPPAKTQIVAEASEARTKPVPSQASAPLRRQDRFMENLVPVRQNLWDAYESLDQMLGARIPPFVRSGLTEARDRVAALIEHLDG